MIKGIFLSFFVCIASYSFCQDKYDNIWLLGYPPNLPSLKVGGSSIDFKSLNPEVTYFEISIALGANSSICDADGNLLFYTNGCQIINNKHELMLSGDSLNYGDIFENACSFSYPTWQGIITLPYPEKDSLFAIFHLMQIDDISNHNVSFLQSVVNINRDEGLGEVISKNELILEDFFTDQITAARHGNGRDWWIIVPKFESNLYYIFLFDQTGITLINEQNIGIIWNNFDWSGQVVFSPNGNKYVRGNAFNEVQIFDFDRCSGIFSNPITLSLPSETRDSIGLGLGISVNSHFLYVSTHY